MKLSATCCRDSSE
uniref:Uncharacterized protein n=1 Tax=Arundo donax TaxID=35708 RepID=A0A0A9UN13_ARUDO